MRKVLLVYLVFAVVDMKAQPPVLWGMPVVSGAANASIFRLNGDGTGFHRFVLPNGSQSDGSLFEATDGLLYAMNGSGGTEMKGQLFSFNPYDSSYNVLVNLVGSNGEYPSGNLIQATNGKLYGFVRAGGGSNVFGLIFSYDFSTHMYTNLHDFYCPGGEPYGSPIQVGNSLYGMTRYGGVNGDGSIIEFNISNNSCPNLHAFDSVDGIWPLYGSLIEINSVLYGMNSTYGPQNGGVLFGYNLSNQRYFNVHNFDSVTGRWPHGSVIKAIDGKLYGTTSSGGSYDDGVIFSFNLSDSTYTVLHQFDSITGARPQGDLLEASDGKLYGMANQGGAYNYGTIFRFDPASNLFTKIFDFDGTNEGYPKGNLIELKYTTGISLYPSVNDKFSITPNPANASVTISVDENRVGSTITVTDVTGRVIAEFILETSNFQLLTENFALGVYFLQAVLNRERVVKKFVKQ